jgi:hypothetical protein
MVMAAAVLCAILAFVILVARLRSGRRSPAADAKNQAHEFLASTRTAQSFDQVNQPTLSEAVRLEDRPVNNMTFDVVYRDADGEVSARRIEIASVSQNYGVIYVDAWCHLRRSERTFRPERMIELSSALTGELVASPAETLIQFANRKRVSGSGLDPAIKRAHRGLLSLIWLARADHDVSQAEVEIMLGYIKDRGLLEEADGPAQDWKEWAARHWIDGQRPTFEEALNAKRMMTHSGREESLCAEYAERILAAQPAALSKTVAKRIGRLGLKRLATP